MSSLFKGRFKYSNPYLRDFVIIMEEFYERADAKIKPIAEVETLFLNDSVNSLEVSKND